MKKFILLFLLLSVRASAQDCPQYIAEHVVGSRPTVPAAYFLIEALKKVQASQDSSNSLVYLESFSVAEALPYTTQTSVQIEIEKKRILCRNEETIHAKGNIRQSKTGQMPALNLSLDPGLPQLLHTRETIYDLLSTGKLQYGETFRRLISPVEVAGNVARGTLESHPIFRGESAIHPTLLDAAFHVLAGFSNDQAIRTRPDHVAVPAYFAFVHWDPSISSSDGKYVSTVRLHRDSSKPDQVTYDLVLENSQHQVLLTIEEGQLQIANLSRLVKAN